MFAAQAAMVDAKIPSPQIQGRRGYERASHFSRFQIEAAGTNPEKSTAARTVCDDGFPGSLGRTDAPNKS
jgi:hypothetical protein